MISDFLIKIYKGDFSGKGREDFGIFACYVGIVINVLLVVLKMSVGIIGGSIAIIADSVNSLSDVLSAFISLMGFKLSRKPADKEHPFGHARTEYISAILVSFLIFLLAYEFIKTSIDKIINPHVPNLNLLTYIVLLLASLGSLLRSRFFKKSGLLINSTPLFASSKDAFNDVITTVVILIISVISKYFNIALDGYAGVLVSIMLLKSAKDIMMDSISPLLGESPDNEIVSEIKKIVESQKGIIGSHDLIVHNYGPNKCMASIHAEVASSTDILVSHVAIDKAEKEVFDKLGISLLIHMDPVDLADVEIFRLKELVNEILSSEPDIDAHDFRIIRGSGSNLFIFDVEVPFDYTKTDEIYDKIKEKIPEYKCVINFENSYV